MAIVQSHIRNEGKLGGNIEFLRVHGWLIIIRKAMQQQRMLCRHGQENATVHWAMLCANQHAKWLNDMPYRLLECDTENSWARLSGRVS